MPFATVGASTAPTVAPAKPDTGMPIMATMTVTDLPSSRALDYKAMSAIRGAGAGDWCLYAFVPFDPRPRILPSVIYETNYFAHQLNLEIQNIDVKNSGSGATITIGALQNALNNISVAPASPHP
jgi:hypothetical protein